MLARLGEQSGVVAKAFSNRAPSTGDAVDVRSLDERVTVGAHVIPAQIVHDDHEEVGPLVGVAAMDETRQTEKRSQKAVTLHGDG